MLQIPLTCYYRILLFIRALISQILLNGRSPPCFIKNIYIHKIYIHKSFQPTSGVHHVQIFVYFFNTSVNF